MGKQNVVQEKKPWDRRKGEPKTQYTYFMYYLTMEKPRNLKEVAEHYKKKTQSVRNWSAKHEWRDRASEYDIHLIEQIRERREEEFIKLQTNAIETEIIAGQLLKENIESLRERQQTKGYFSQTTVSSTLLNHERSMTEHINNFYLLCGKPSKINPQEENEDINRRIPLYATDEQLRDELDSLLEDGSSESELGNVQQEDKE